jgi:hypothetical protein
LPYVKKVVFRKRLKIKVCRGYNNLIYSSLVCIWKHIDGEIGVHIGADQRLG